MGMVTVADVVRLLDALVVPARPAPWDNVGLILGQRFAPVERVLTCLTVTPEVVSEAVGMRANLIVTHHPMLFRPVQKLTDATPEGQMVLDLLRAGIAVYSPHTSFDNCTGGINDQLAKLIDLQDVRPLRPADGEKRVKVIVFVPEGDIAKVADAMFGAGAGQIGQYCECSFRSSGIGTFFGSEDTNPSVGQIGRREEVAEWRLEVICPDARVEAVISAMRTAHSYEEPAFDVVPLRSLQSDLGEGRIGRLPAPISLAELASQIRSGLSCGPVQVIGRLEKTIQRVAIACGAGGEFLEEAIAAGSDALFTGEMRFHDYLRAKVTSTGVVLPGHFATERIGCEWLVSYISTKTPQIQAVSSHAETDPVKWQ
jgi:dinuclear metal center YbgI/SA1388 family protein